jgi:iron(III) transport system ATP-binding protein
MSAVELRFVSKAYDGRRVIDGISLILEPGERVALVGPSGCGKTTLLRLIAGLDVPDRGEIWIGSKRVAEAGRSIVEPEHRHVGMVFQDLALWPHMTIEQHLAFALRYSFDQDIRQRAARVLDVLRMVRLADRASAKPGQLSGGEQQRVALARALVAGARVLLMDEPLSSLDPELNVHLRREILQLHRQLAFTLIYVTHSREEADDVASRVIEMERGRAASAGGRTVTAQDHAC